MENTMDTEDWLWALAIFVAAAAAGYVVTSLIT
jgi:hypothetical protein